MRKMYLFVLILMVSGVFTMAQVNKVAQFNAIDVTGQADTLRPWSSDKGVRSVAYAGDMDNDGKPDFVATDYTNGGRVHVLELNPANNKLEIVWSSKTRVGTSSGSTPRWVRVGDMDGDGNKEIVFPLTTTSADFEVHLYEFQGTDNNYGTEPAFTLPATYFSAQNVGSFRTNREVAAVEDFDGDGLDELIMSNRDNNVYILGVFGQFPGFASWQLEGGDPAVVPVNSGKFSTSHWQSVPADLDGDGKIEIANHMWNNWAFWSIKPVGPDAYAYPDTSKPKFYAEIFKGTPVGDAVSYMGIEAVDVDGDGNDELAGILYGGAGENYSLALIDFATTDTGLYVWDPAKGGVIASEAWTVSGATAGNFWGIGSADLNGNGKEEIFMGGGGLYEIIGVEYKGTGNLLDPNSYDKYVVYSEPTIQYGIYDFRDSLGVKDTVRTEVPFISKMEAGFDFNNNGKKELIASYQSVYDSLTYNFYTYNVDSSKYIKDSTKKVNNLQKVNVKYFEYGTTGIEVKELTIVTPDDYTLEQNYPNPFNPSTTIRFSIPVDKKISLKIYDILGNLVTTLIDGQDFANGSYEAVWDGKNNFGTSVASGMYLAELQFGNFSKTIKMQLLK